MPKCSKCSKDGKHSVEYGGGYGESHFSYLCDSHYQSENNACKAMCWAMFIIWPGGPFWYMSALILFYCLKLESLFGLDVNSICIIVQICGSILSFCMTLYYLAKAHLPDNSEFYNGD